VYPALHDIRSVALTSGELQNSTHDFLLYAGTSAGILGLAAIVTLIVLPAAFALRAATRRDPHALVFVLLAAYVAQGAVTISDLSLEWVPFVAAGFIAAAWTTAFGFPAHARFYLQSAISLNADLTRSTRYWR